METLSNFSSIYCFITFIFGAVFMLATLCIVAISKDKDPSNNVHFYVARDKDGTLWLYIGKPLRDKTEFHADSDGRIFCLTSNIEYYGLKYEDYANLEWEDEPLEVFVNMKD